nr:MAG TPA: E2-like protein [Caudoviricetes sp.]
MIVIVSTLVKVSFLNHCYYDFLCYFFCAH